MILELLVWLLVVVFLPMAALTVFLFLRYKKERRFVSDWDAITRAREEALKETGVILFRVAQEWGSNPQLDALIAALSRGRLPVDQEARARASEPRTLVVSREAFEELKKLALTQEVFHRVPHLTRDDGKLVYDPNCKLCQEETKSP